MDKKQREVEVALGNVDGDNEPVVGWLTGDKLTLPIDQPVGRNHDIHLLVLNCRTLGGRIRVRTRAGDTLAHGGIGEVAADKEHGTIRVSLRRMAEP